MRLSFINLFALVVLLPSNTFAQDNGYTLITDEIEISAASSTPVSLAFETVILPHSVISAKVFVAVEASDNRYFYQNPLATPIANFDLDFGNTSSHVMQLGKPITQKIITEDLNLVNNALQAVSNPTPIKITVNTLDPNLKLRFGYEIYLGVEVSTAPQISISSFVQNENIQSEKLKSATLTWSDPEKNPNYEIQILKLSNEDALASDEFSIIEVDFDDDWNRALRLTTNGQQEVLNITLAEASGFYLARIRPIGTFHEGGISDFRNFGAWDYAPIGLVSFDRQNLIDRALFFEDPDEEINWIYNRVFTEKSRIKENYTLADPLLNVRQSQTILPSQNNVLITESQLDYVGRPSLSAMPVPVSDEDGLVFKNQFFQPNNALDPLYLPEYFDEDSNLLDPTPVDDSQAGYSYYAQSNTDERIPSAEGYPYSRTLYERDPTNRPREQSGVGPIHMLNTQQSDVTGRTVKTYYATASETELIRLFGDEAPRSNSVSKTIMLDQNNVAQVQYSNLDGQVLATALIEQVDEYTSDNLLDLNHYAGNAGYTITDHLTANINDNNGGILSGKRFVLMQTSPLNFTYTLDCPLLALPCHEVEVDCQWDLEVKIINVHDASSPITEFFQLSSIPCDANNQKVVSNTSSHVLQPGTYFIEKRLRRSDAVEADIQDAKEKIELQINPIVEIVLDELENICSLDDVDNFYQFLTTFSNDLNQLASNPTANGNAQFNSNYGIADPDFEITADHQLILLTNAGKPSKMILKSACCAGIEVDVTYQPPFQCPDNYNFPANLGANNKPDVNIDYNNSEWPVDFEGYALDVMTKKCPGMTPLTFYQDYMSGWDVGEFNWMVYHMLTDQYDCDGTQSLENPDPNPSPPPANNECMNQGVEGIGVSCDANNNCSQYDCQQLFYCWESIINIFVQRACNDLSDLYDQTNGSSTISDAVDDENGGNGQIQDDHIDENMSGFMQFVMWVTGASGKMREEQENIGNIPAGGNWGELTEQFNLVQEFLDCAGYRFADVITGPGQALDADVTAHNALPGADPIAEFTCPSAPNKDCWSPTDPFDSSRPLFSHIPNNIFAFKYYYYAGHGGDEGLLTMEVQSCYRDPNKCYDSTTGVEIPCCPNLNPDELCEFCDLGIIQCDATEADWSCGQRLTFYEMITNYKTGTSTTSPDLKLVSCDDDPTIIEEFVENRVRGMQDQCSSNCEFRRAEFRNELIKVLQARCYNIGECRGANETTNIPWEDIDLMVESLVAQCLSQCEISTYACITDRKCIGIDKAFQYDAAYQEQDQILIGVGGTSADSCTGTVISNTDGDVNITECLSTGTFSFCDLSEWEQAMGWQLEIEIPSVCAPGTAGATPAFQCLNDVDHFCINRQQIQELYSPYGAPNPNQSASTDTKILTITNN